MNGSSRWVRVGAVGLVLCVLVLSRAVLAPKYLFYFDSVNFALALADFDPAKHQPQPPGYPLFVGLARLVAWFVMAPQLIFLITGLIASAGALALTWKLGRDLFGERAANFAVLLLLFHPPFWFGALTNQVRLFLAIGSAAVMIAAWKSLLPNGARWFVAAAALLGILSGFRPGMVLFGLPLLLWCGWKGDRSWREWCAAAASGAVCIGLWLGVVLAQVGGIERYIQLLWAYSSEQFGPTSLMFGAENPPAWRMFKMSLLWYGLPVLTWLWAVPFARGAGRHLAPKAAFLTLAFLPTFLFHTFVHVGDPDHTLFGAVALCVTGGLVLSQLRMSRVTSPIPLANARGSEALILNRDREGAVVTNYAGQHTSVVAAIAVTLNVFLFFSPPKGIAQAFSYRAVREIDELTRATFSRIDELKKTGPVSIITRDHPITWRHLFYYYPDCSLIVLPEDPDRAGSSSQVWTFLNKTLQTQNPANAEILLPRNARVVWLLPQRRAFHRILGSQVTLKQHGSLFYFETNDALRLKIGAYRFSVEDTPQTAVAARLDRTAK